MNNYEYIIASLPVIDPDARIPEGFSAEKIVAQIKEQLSEKDCRTVDLLLSSFEDANLTRDFYAGVLKSDSPFLREYFRFDLNMRNAKVRFLNRKLGRPAEQDVMDLDGGVFEEQKKMQDVLETEDIYSRERGIDDLAWNKISDMTLFNYFNMTVILAFIAKLHIIDRWLKLDEEAGREMFRKLVEEVRGTFKGVEFNE